MREPTLLERVAAVEAESRDRSEKYLKLQAAVEAESRDRSEKYLKLQAAVEAAKGIAMASRAETEMLRAELDREREKSAGLAGVVTMWREQYEHAMGNRSRGWDQRFLDAETDAALAAYKGA